MNGTLSALWLAAGNFWVPATACAAAVAWVLICRRLCASAVLETPSLSTPRRHVDARPCRHAHRRRARLHRHRVSA